MSVTLIRVDDEIAWYLMDGLLFHTIPIDELSEPRHRKMARGVLDQVMAAAERHIAALKGNA
jgi:hypothetical protein